MVEVAIYWALWYQLYGIFSFLVYVLGCLSLCFYGGFSIGGCRVVVQPPLLLREGGTISAPGFWFIWVLFWFFG